MVFKQEQVSVRELTKEDWEALLARADRLREEIEAGGHSFEENVSEEALTQASQDLDWTIQIIQQMGQMNMLLAEVSDELRAQILELQREDQSLIIKP